LAEEGGKPPIAGCPGRRDIIEAWLAVASSGGDFDADGKERLDSRRFVGQRPHARRK